MRKLASKDNYVNNRKGKTKVKKKISKGSDLHLTLNIGREKTKLDNQGSLIYKPNYKL